MKKEFGPLDSPVRKIWMRQFFNYFCNIDKSQYTARFFFIVKLNFDVNPEKPLVVL